MKQLRLAQISSVQVYVGGICGPGGKCVSFDEYFFTDSNTGYKSPYYTYSGEKNSPDPQVQAQQARTDYSNGISAQMDTTLQKAVYDVASNWDKLVSDPVHQPSS